MTLKVQRENKFCCEEHIDMAFDDFINDNETFPDFEYVSGMKCSYCSNDAKYMLILKSSTDDDK